MVFKYYIGFQRVYWAVEALAHAVQSQAIACISTEISEFMKKR